jgi:hypothetical protein
MVHFIAVCVSAPRLDVKGSKSGVSMSFSVTVISSKPNATSSSISRSNKSTKLSAITHGQHKPGVPYQVGSGEKRTITGSKANDCDGNPLDTNIGETGSMLYPDRDPDVLSWPRLSCLSAFVRLSLPEGLLICYCRPNESSPTPLLRFFVEPMQWRANCV